MIEYLNHYMFSDWSDQETSYYRAIKSDLSIDETYRKERISENPVERTRFLLRSLNISSKDYETLVRNNGRPEILRDLEARFTSLST